MQDSAGRHVGIFAHEQRRPSPSTPYHQGRCLGVVSDQGAVVVVITHGCGRLSCGREGNTRSPTLSSQPSSFLMPTASLTPSSTGTNATQTLTGVLRPSVSLTPLLVPSDSQAESTNMPTRMSQLPSETPSSAPFMTLAPTTSNVLPATMAPSKMAITFVLILSPFGRCNEAKGRDSAGCHQDDNNQCPMSVNQELLSLQC